MSKINFYFVSFREFEAGKLPIKCNIIYFVFSFLYDISIFNIEFIFIKWKNLSHFIQGYALEII